MGKSASISTSSLLQLKWERWMIPRQPQLVKRLTTIHLIPICNENSQSPERKLELSTIPQDNLNKGSQFQRGHILSIAKQGQDWIIRALWREVSASRWIRTMFSTVDRNSDYRASGYSYTHTIHLYAHTCVYMHTYTGLHIHIERHTVLRDTQRQRW